MLSCADRFRNIRQHAVQVQAAWHRSAGPEFAPVHEARKLIRELHSARNHRPIAETMRRLLEACADMRRSRSTRAGPDGSRTSIAWPRWRVRRMLGGDTDVPQLCRISRGRGWRRRGGGSAGAGTEIRRSANDDRTQSERARVSGRHSRRSFVQAHTARVPPIRRFFPPSMRAASAPLRSMGSPGA